MNKKGICTLTLALSLSLTSAVLASNVNKERIFGLDRYETSAKICDKEFTSSTEVAFIVSGENFPDALCTSPLAKKYNAPILLTSKSELNSNVKERLIKLNVKKVFIIGGNGSISEKVVNEIKALNIEVERISGTTRYETSIKIAEKMDGNSEAVVTTSSLFADALSIAPIAAMKSMPILLVNKDNIPKETEEFIKNYNINKVYLIGGPGVITDAVKNKLPNAERLYGNTRYETNINIINHFKDELDLSKSIIASGENFPDALSGSMIAAINKAPLVLLNDSPGKNTDNFLKENKNSLKHMTILGGVTGVSEDAYSYAVGDKARPQEILGSLSESEIRNYVENGWDFIINSAVGLNKDILKHDNEVIINDTYYHELKDEYSTREGLLNLLSENFSKEYSSKLINSLYYEKVNGKYYIVIGQPGMAFEISKSKIIDKKVQGNKLYITWSGYSEYDEQYPSTKAVLKYENGKVVLDYYEELSEVGGVPR